MSKLKVRLISAFFGIIVVLGIIFAPSVVFYIAMMLVSFIMLYELHTTFQMQEKWQLVALNYLFAAAVFCMPVFFPYDRIVFVITAYIMMLMIFSVLFHSVVKFADVTKSLFMLLYAVLLPLHLNGVRMMGHGLYLIFIPLLGAWMPDTFAYFTGCLLGKHKLIPAISPNKTVEGSVGAVAGSLLMFAVYGLLMDFAFGFTVNYIALLSLGLICGVVSQLGDLSASVIKREFGIKDFGNLIPGHGGLVDRVDSLLFIAPVVYYFLSVFEVIYK